MTLPKGAVFSEDGRYRYVLWRLWNRSKELVAFILLNASTADARNDDPTVRRLIGFTDRWGYGGFLLGNAFAYQTMNPRELCEPYNSEPVGSHNDEWLLEIVKRTRLTVVGWGNWGELGARGKQVFDLLHSQREVFCLGVTKRGQPTHPLYIARDVPIVKYGT